MFYDDMCSNVRSTRMRDGPVIVEYFNDIVSSMKTIL